jgi:hypothetical protein
MQQRARRNLAVIGFPLLHPLERQRIIGILLDLGVPVDHDQRQNHFLQLDLIDRAQSSVEMRRWIHVRSPLADMSVRLRAKSLAHRPLAFGVTVNRLAFLVGKTGPVRNPRREGVRQIDQLFTDKDLLNTREARLVFVSRCDGCRDESDHQRCACRRPPLHGSVCRASLNNRPTTSNSGQQRRTQTLRARLSVFRTSVIHNDSFARCHR